MNNLPISQYAKKAAITLNDIILIMDKLKKYSKVPENFTKDINQLRTMLGQLDTDLSARDPFKVKIDLLTKELYQLIKNCSKFSRKEKKEFQQGVREFNQTSGGGLMSSDYKGDFHRHNRQVQGFNWSREKTFSSPDIKRDYKPVDALTSLHSSQSTFEGVPDIIMSRLAYNKIKVWCQAIDEEIQALGIVQMIEGDFFIKDFFLFKQVVSKTTCTEKDAQALVDLMIDVESKGYRSGDLKVWWHSHNSMGVTPSAQDLETTSKFGARDYIISLISNHRGDFNSKISFTKPFKFEIKNLPVYVQDDITQEFFEEQIQSIKNLVETESRSYFSSGPSHYNPDHLMPTPLINNYSGEEKANDNLVSLNEGPTDEVFTDEEIVSKVEAREAPFDHSFQEGDINYVWNSSTCRYDAFESSGKKLTLDELAMLGAVDYNQMIDDAIENVKEIKPLLSTNREGA